MIESGTGRARPALAGITVLPLLAGVAVLAAAAFAVGRSSEDFCFHDMVEYRYDAASPQGELFWPGAEGVLRGRRPT